MNQIVILPGTTFKRNKKILKFWSIFDKNWSTEKVLKNFTSFLLILSGFDFSRFSVFSFCLIKMILRRYSNILLLLRFIFIKEFVKTHQIFKWGMSFSKICQNTAFSAVHYAAKYLKSDRSGKNAQKLSRIVIFMTLS